MALQSEFEGIHSGEEMLIIGAGPSLRNIPPAFLESRRSVTVNLVPAWYPFLHFDYWVALDKHTVDPEIYNAVPSLSERTFKFVPRRYRNWIEQKTDFWDESWVELRLPEVPGVPWSKDYGAAFSSSLPAGAELAILMGAQRVLVVGFDCTRRNSAVTHYQLPHFYGADLPGEYEESWDRQFGRLRDWADDQGVEILNLSEPTVSRYLRRAHWSDFWSPVTEYKEEADGTYFFPS